LYKNRIKKGEIPISKFQIPNSRARTRTRPISSASTNSISRSSAKINFKINFYALSSIIPHQTSIIKLPTS
jgi:hypothetical protein